MIDLLTGAVMNSLSAVAWVWTNGAVLGALAAAIFTAWYAWLTFGIFRWEQTPVVTAHEATRDGGLGDHTLTSLRNSGQGPAFNVCVHQQGQLEVLEFSWLGCLGPGEVHKLPRPVRIGFVEEHPHFIWYQDARRRWYGTRLAAQGYGIASAWEARKLLSQVPGTVRHNARAETVVEQFKRLKRRLPQMKNWFIGWSQGQAPASPRETDEKREGMSTYEKWNIAITLAGVAVGIVVLAIYYGQLRQMKSVTKTTADSLAFMREVVERPYLVMDALNPYDDRAFGTAPHLVAMGFETNKRPSFNVGIRNVGRSPASHLAVNLEIRETFAPMQFPLRFDAEKTQMLGAIPGGATRYRWVTRQTEFTHSEVEELRLAPPKRRHFYVLGFIDYADVSGKTKYDRVEFCMIFNPDPMRPYTPDGNVLFDVCPNPNDAKTN